MGLSAAFHSALSGLTTASRATDIVSGNISNASTPGYVRRSLSLDSNPISGGVLMSGVNRHANVTLIAQRRDAEAFQANTHVTTSYLSGVSDAVGTPDQPGSLGATLARFENDLIRAAADPSATHRLDTVVRGADALARKIGSISESIQTARQTADTDIALQVDTLNAALKQVETLNGRIQRATATGQSTNTLQDQRQLAIDTINTIIPVQQIMRPNNQIGLYSQDGLLMLDARAVEFGFTPTRLIGPKDLAGGALSGLTMNGDPVRTAPTHSQISGGRLDALFNIRDNLAIEAQTDIDEVAADLVLRFQNPATDPTLTPTQTGLFTDSGARFDPADHIGISQRIGLNPTASADSWRLRDGIGAITPGAVGDATQINRFTAVLAELRPSPTDRFGPGAQNMAGLISALTAKSASIAVQGEESLSFSVAQFADAQTAEQANGVDTDHELQNLMRIEHAYAANARVLSVLDDMLATVMGI